MGKALLELISKMRGHKLDDGKSVGGKGRLTRRMVDHIQNNYGAAIRSNVGSIDAMYDAIWALFKHIVVDSALSLVNNNITSVQGTAGVSFGWTRKSTQR